MSFYLADISEYQADINDAEYLAWSKSIVIRALYGADHVDASWYAGSRRSALHTGGATFVGIYQYLVAGQSGATQAQEFHKLVGPIQQGEVFIADFEEGEKSMLTAWYNAMIALYGSAITPYLWTYTDESFGADQDVLPVQWIADYSAHEPASTHTLWQFSETYSTPGIGVGDMSICHLTPAQLAAKAYGSPIKPVPSNWTDSNWSYAEPRKLAAVGGKTTVKLTWESPRATTPAYPAGKVVPYPPSYTIRIWKKSGGDAVTTRTTTATEIQIGSLPKNEYVAQVWANGGPVAPEGADVDFATSG